MWYLQIKDYEEGSAAVWSNVEEYLTYDEARLAMQSLMAERGEEDLLAYRIREYDTQFDGMVNGEY